MPRAADGGTVCCWEVVWGQSWQFQRNGRRAGWDRSMRRMEVRRRDSRVGPIGEGSRWRTDVQGPEGTRESGVGAFTSQVRGATRVSGRGATRPYASRHWSGGRGVCGDADLFRPAAPLCTCGVDRASLRAGRGSGLGVRGASGRHGSSPAPGMAAGLLSWVRNPAVPLVTTGDGGSDTSRLLRWASVVGTVGGRAPGPVPTPAVRVLRGPGQSAAARLSTPVNGLGRAGENSSDADDDHCLLSPACCRSCATTGAWHPEGSWARGVVCAWWCPQWCWRLLRTRWGMTHYILARRPVNLLSDRDPGSDCQKCPRPQALCPRPQALSCTPVASVPRVPCHLQECQAPHC